MLSLLIAAALSVETPGWATFGMIVVSPHRMVTVGSLPAASGEVYWLRENDRGKIRWTDTRQCPAALTAIRSMSAIPDLPAPAPKSDGPLTITIDEVSYSLRSDAVPATDGKPLAMYGHRGSALAEWVDTTQQALRPCWSPIVPNE